jgi:hypothetical protein
MRFAGNNAMQKIPATKIPVLQPQIAGLHQLDEFWKQAPFLGVPVATEDGLGDEIPGRLEHDQSKAGQRSGLLLSKCLAATVGGSDHVSVNDPKPVSGNEYRLRRRDFTENLNHFLGGFTDKGLRNRDFDARDFVIHGVHGKRKLFVPRLVRGMNFRSNFTGDKEHEFDEERKKDVALTLCPDILLENVLQKLRLENIFEQGSGHDGYGSVFGYPIEQFILKHAAPPCETTKRRRSKPEKPKSINTKNNFV